MAKKAVKRVNTPKKGANATAVAAAATADKAEKKAEKVEPEKEKKVEKVVEKKEETKPTPKVEKTEPEKVDKSEKVEKVKKEEKEIDDKDDKKTTDNEESENTTADDSANLNLDETNEENASSESPEKKNDRAESPLNILIGEEEESLLLNSGDEQEGADPEDKTEDDNEKTEENSQVEIKAEPDEKEEQDKDQTDKTVDTSIGAESATMESPSKTSESEQAKAAMEKSKNSLNKSNQGRSLWVTNLLPSTRAQELKHLLSRYGKVIGAKVVQSSRHPRTRCYGYVTMETRAAADLCIKKLNNTELKGQIIRVAKVRPEHSLPLKSVPETTENADKSKTTPVKQDEKAPKAQDEKPKRQSSVEKKSASTEKKKDAEKPPSTKGSKEREVPKSRSTSRKDRSFGDKPAVRRDKKTDVLTFDKIREERNRQRARERERAAREEKKRRRDIQIAREIEIRQREEAQRLEREREKLRLERDRLDRQRQEILRLERERQKLEREKLEQEKQELRRQQLRLEEARRPIKRPAATSTSTYRRDATGYPDDRKREAREDRHYEEAPPPPRFEVPAREPTREIPPKKEIEKDYKSHISYTKHSEEYPKRSEYKREFPSSERHYGSSHIVHGANNGGSSKYESSTPYVNREREMREPNRREAIASVGPPKISSEVRYNERPAERSPVSYRGVRDERERRPISEHHAKGDIRSSRDSRDHRYGEPPSSIKESSRYREGNSWHSGGPSPTQPFSGIGPNSSSRESWNKDNWRPMETGSNERWVGNSSSRIIISGSSGVPGPLYSAGNSSSMSCPPPPGSSSYTIDRFDNYKSLSNPRKY